MTTIDEARWLADEEAKKLARPPIDELIGALALRTVGNITFLEDSNGVIHVDVRNLVRPSRANRDIECVEVAEFLLSTVNKARTKNAT